MENQSKEVFLPRKVFLEKTKILDMRYYVALYLTGGVSFDLINEKGYDTDFNQKNAKYKAIKIIDGLDMVQLTNLIRKTVCSNND